MDRLVPPEFLLLLLEQEVRSLKDHTRLFLLLAHTTSYLDDALCTFYDASLNTASRALSSRWSSRGFHRLRGVDSGGNGSPLTICPVDDLARSTPEPRAQPTIPAVRSTSPIPPMAESHFPLRSMSQRKAMRLSRRSSRKLIPTRQIRCESRLQCPPQGSKPWTV